MKYLELTNADLEQVIPESILLATKGVNLPHAGSPFVAYSLILEVDNRLLVAVGLRDDNLNRIEEPDELEEESWFNFFTDTYLTSSEINVIISNSDRGDLNV